MPVLSVGLAVIDPRGPKLRNHAVFLVPNSLLPPPSSLYSRFDFLMPTRLDRITRLWEYTQVGLSGRYSSDRALSLASYVKEVGIFRTLIVILATPLPCLLATVLVDVVKLDDPTLGLHGNTTFIIREYASYWLMSFLGAQQFRTSVPILSYPMVLVIFNTFIVAAISVGVLYGFGLIIGFPVPFTIIVGCTGWVTSLSASLVLVWRNKIREKPEAWPMVINVFKQWMCQVTLVIVYPLYFYVFTTLSHVGQIIFALLLPVIKIFARGALTRTMAHARDDMPEVVIFNAEVFNALFVSYCMQNSPSIWTTLELMAVDVIQMMLSLRKMKNAHQKLDALSRQVEQESSWESRVLSCKRNSKLESVSTPLERAQLLLSTTTSHLAEAQSATTPLVRMTSVLPQPVENTESDIPEGPMTELSRSEQPRGCFKVKRRLVVWPRRNVVAPTRSVPQLPSTLQYTTEVRRLLYMSEFLLLHNYVEVIIPLVFCAYAIYLGIMYQLPNRKYYAQLADIDEGELLQTLHNVLLYCVLQFFSLMAMIVMLHTQLGLSPLHQLAFVLEKQFAGAQIKLVFWVFYNVQASLQHWGFDYTFEFAWLNQDTQ